MERSKRDSGHLTYLLRTKTVISLIVQICILTVQAAYGVEGGIMQGMIDAHNKIRREVGAPGLVWSNELARYAQEWADYLANQRGCTMQHRSATGSTQLKYGENLYWASGIRWTDGRQEIQQVSPAKVVLSWAEEAEYYNYAANSCQKGKVCGHYTQVVWKESKFLGCGQAVCSRDKSQVWVCNYNPPGNIVGYRPY